MAAEEWATFATNQIVGKIQTFPQSLSIPFCFLPDLTGVKFGSTCPPLAGAAEFRTVRIAPTPLSLRLAPPANQTDRPATGRLLRWSSGSRLSRVVWAIRGDRVEHHSQRLPKSFFLFPDLTRVKFGSARPPLGGCYGAHPPGHALPNFQPVVMPQPPLVAGSRLQPIGPINLPLAGRSDGPLAPDLRGRCGRSGDDRRWYHSQRPPLSLSFSC